MEGKEEQDQQDLLAEAPPIYIQEKIDPRVLIENLRQTAARPEDEPELTLFEAFDGLDELDIVDFYKHDANWSNRMILGDSLNVMASLAEREALRGKVQMIYIDPPYGIKFGSNWQVSTRKRDVKDGRIEDASREVEQIKAFRDTWELGIHSYLAYLRDRLTVARDLLSDSGSIFVQIGDENVHLVRSIMDEIFGSENFVVQIAVQKTGSQTGDLLQSNVDFLLWYAKSHAAAKYRPPFAERVLGQAGSSGYRMVTLADGTDRPLLESEKRDPRLLPTGARLWSANPLTSEGYRPTTTVPFEFGGRVFHPGPRRHWGITTDQLARVAAAGRIVAQNQQIRQKTYLDDFPVFPLGSYWSDLGGAVDLVYIVQTNTKVIQRCLLMTTDPGDLVLDPTCGSGTTAYVAEQWGRRWITIDTSRVALALARQRMMGARFPYYLLADSVEGRAKESELSTDPLPTAPVSHDIRHGLVYERVHHVTLKSIANNPDIMEGMSQRDIDAAIKRHAEYELLYDKPYEEKKKVRVTGPFTVESLSPHRSIAFAGSAAQPGVGAVNDELTVDLSGSESDFQQSILANLRAAGIQNGRKGDRIEFESLEPYAAAYIQAVGDRKDPPEEAPKRMGVTIGPQYGTVGGTFVKDAAREALKAEDIDLLAILAFAFEPQVVGGDDFVTTNDGFANVAAERKLGRIPVLLVRMNADLLMGNDLKKTGAGNLFTVFGEPDLEVVEDGGGKVRVRLRGVDVYDPNTGEIRSDSTDQIALWMVDTNYNGESFFVRHCYFTGGQDPYKRLKHALKADINEEAWESLYSTESRAFDRPETGRIAVKVINDYGDEVMKVFETPGA